jgi:hypothetical protein
VRDPNALREVLQMANDPEIMKQAKVRGPESLLGYLPPYILSMSRVFFNPTNTYA